MKALCRYALVATLLVVVGGAVTWPFLDAVGRKSMAIAAAVALPVQLGTFLLMIPALSDRSRFIVRWGVGVLVRMAVVAGVGLMLPRLDALNGTVLLLSICSFFFAFILLEPVFLGGKREEVPA